MSRGASFGIRRSAAGSCTAYVRRRATWGSRVAGVVDSGLPGPKGNREFLVHLLDSPEPTVADDLDRWIDDAVG